MQPHFDDEKGTIVLEFDTADELRSFVVRARERNRLQVRLLQPLRAEQSVGIRLLHGRAGIDLKGSIRHVYRSAGGKFGTTIDVSDWSPCEGMGAGLAGSGSGDRQPRVTIEASQAAQTELVEETDEGLPEVVEETDEESAMSDGSPETDGTSPIFKVKQMNVSQRMRLGATAGKSVRQILLRDNSPQVMMGLLSNPRIEDQEVLEMMKSPYVAGGVLQRVAKDRRFAGNYEIQLALVKNPKTPSPLALRLLETLRTKDLQVLAKGSMVRDQIKNAALRIYLKRK